MFFYVLFGQDLRKRKIISKKTVLLDNQKQINADLNLPETNLVVSTHFNLVKLLSKNSDALVYNNNKIEVFSNGESTFNAVFEAIQNAKEHIHIEFFIFDDDKISNQLRELLIQKAKEGVRIRMIYDYWGSFDLTKKYLKSLRDAGVHVRSFLPFKFRFRFSSSDINYRNHRKIVIVDGIIGFTGGLNVADRYIYGNTLGHWRDTFISIEGAAVHGLQRLFLHDWHFVERKNITDKKYFPTPLFYTNNAIQIVSSGPDSDWESIMQGIAAAILSATKYIYIQSPYFMPNDIVANAIHMAALSGVEVRLMIPDKSDSKLSDASTSSYLGRVLEAGVTVFRYKVGFLHSKAIVIDDTISIVGSCNLDERSFGQNYEVNAFVFDQQTALKLKKLFHADMLKCSEQTLEEWSNRKRRQKLKESFARLFSPLM
jgi:cardiolipin synthase